MRGAAERDQEADEALEDVARAMAGRSRAEIVAMIEDGMAAARERLAAQGVAGEAQELARGLIAMRSSILLAMVEAFSAKAAPAPP